MYLKHFGLASAPFSITPDTSFVYASRAQQEALATLLLAIDDGAGFIRITGEVGTGKTLLCRRLLAHLALASGGSSDGCETVYIPNPCLSPRTLLLSIGTELKLPLRNVAAEYELLNGLNSALLDFAARGRRVVVCLDEVQAMPRETLEALRLLSNLETESRKLVQVVLFGQPELDAKLAQPELRQLASRIGFGYTLGALSAAETEAYLAHRLAVATRPGILRAAPVFAPKAARAVHEASRGVPRLINLVAHKCLLLAYGEGVHAVTRRHVRAAAADTPAARRPGFMAGLRTRLAGWWSQRRTTIAEAR
jgi:MSHA biogenesis protein MshM